MKWFRLIKNNNLLGKTTRLGLFIIVLTAGILVASTGHKEKVISSPLVKELRSCETYPYDPVNFEASSRNICYAKKLRSLVRNNGVPKAVIAMKEYLETKEGKTLEGGRCHGLGHEIGTAAILSGFKGEEIFLGCSDFCNFGCLNGAAHAYVLTGKKPAELEEFCDASETRIRRGCYHGIGHGVANSNNLNIVKALKLCDELKGREAQYECGHATLMEPEMIGARPLASIPRDIPKFCGSLSEVYRNSCFEFAGFLEYIRTNKLEGVARVCGDVPSSFQKNCRERLGEALFLALRSNAEAIVESCGAYHAEGGQIAYDCVFGALRASLNSVDASSAELGTIICKTVSPNLQNQCFANLGKSVGDLYGQESRSKLCLEAGATYQKSCLEYNEK